MSARQNADSNDPSSKLFVQTSEAKKNTYFVGSLCQLSTLSHSAPSHLSVDPLVPQSTGVAGAESRAIGISLCPTAIISFALTTHLLFTFTPEMREAGGGPSQRQWQEQEMMDMKMSFFFPPSLSGWKKMWCHILSELGSWPRGYSC